MILYQFILIACTISAGFAFGFRNPPGPPGAAGIQDRGDGNREGCPPGTANVEGEVGPPGAPGIQGYPGAKGQKGENMRSFTKPPPNTECRCPSGPKGEKGQPGDYGRPGDIGNFGLPGVDGDKGSMGYKGLPGKPGTSGILPRQPRNQPDTMFLPVLLNGKVPKVMCHHVRKQAFVPGVPHGWLGWYETGKSGYLTFDKWLYFSSRFQCPCSVPIPPGPTPSPAELLRLL